MTATPTSCDQPGLRRLPRRVGRAFRGFTLIELLVVVAMVGIIAALAVVGYRKYILSAQSSEATSMLQNIRVAQETYRAEALSYLPVSTSLTGSDLYPRVLTALDEHKTGWGGAGANSAAWLKLNLKPDGPVRFGYGCMAGVPGDGVALPGAVQGAPNPNWANAYGGGLPADPWFVASAIGNRDSDTSYAVFQTASFTNEVLVHDDTE